MHRLNGFISTCTRRRWDPKADKSPVVEPGLWKSSPGRTNRPWWVVLDVGGALNYSTQFLSNPYRLVIDVRSEEVAREAVPLRVLTIRKSGGQGCRIGAGEFAAQRLRCLEIQRLISASRPAIPEIESEKLTKSPR